MGITSLIATVTVVAAAPSGVCQLDVRELSLRAMQVHSNGEREPIDVAIQKLAARVVIPRRGPARIDVLGPIAFTGSARRLWLTVKRATTTEDGLVTLMPGAQLIDAKVVSSTMIEGRVVLDGGDVLDHENDKDAAESLSRVRIPCDAVTLNSIDGDDGDDDVATVTDPSFWSTRDGTNTLRMHDGPSTRRPARVLAAPICGGDACLTVGELETRGPWMKVLAIGRGVAASGWVRRSKLRPNPDGSFGTAGGCTGDHDTGGRGESWVFAPGVRAYRGAATLKRGGG